jgi:hypothetical protein
MLANISIMNVAKVDKVPANPLIMAVTTRDSSGPGLPANKVPRLPLRAQLNKLHVKVPNGNPGIREFHFCDNFHLPITPKGENNNEMANCCSLGVLYKTNDVICITNESTKRAVAMALTLGVSLVVASSCTIRSRFLLFAVVLFLFVGEAPILDRGVAVVLDTDGDGDDRNTVPPS